MSRCAVISRPLNAVNKPVGLEVVPKACFLEMRATGLSIFAILSFIYLRSFAHVHSLLGKEPTDSKRSEQELRSQFQRDDSSSAACLLIMDDNHFLIEWLAYHYHTRTNSIGAVKRLNNIKLQAITRIFESLTPAFSTLMSRFSGSLIIIVSL